MDSNKLARRPRDGLDHYSVTDRDLKQNCPVGMSMLVSRVYGDNISKERVDRGWTSSPYRQVTEVQYI